MIVVLGDVMVDVVAHLSGPVAEGSDSAASIEWGYGGSAANVAAWLARTGRRTTLVGRVGDDPQGRAAAEQLAAAGVDHRLAVDSERATGTCIVLVAPSGERSMLPDAGANDALRPDDLPPELLASAAHLHVAGYALLREGSREAARGAIARAREAGIGVSVDPSSAALLTAEFLEVAQGAGLLLPNADEAVALTGEGDPAAAARELAQRFPEVVVKLGADGALWTDGVEELRVPAMRASPPGALDTTGAGDAFAAGLLAARTLGAEPVEALRAACALAAEAVSVPGARPAPA